MSKTWYGHYIENIKGEDYVLFKDYLELDKEIERLNNIIKKAYKILDEALTEQMITGNATINLVELCAILKGDSSNE